MIVGYARTSTLEQEAGLEAQQRDLTALGSERVFSEQASSVGFRKGLEEALEYTRRGDTFAVTKLDRLARSVPHMWEIVKKLDERGVALRVVNLGMDTSTPTGKLMLTVLGGVAEFEREMMLERQRGGHRQGQGCRALQGPQAHGAREGQAGPCLIGQWCKHGRDRSATRHRQDLGTSHFEGGRPLLNRLAFSWQAVLGGYVATTDCSLTCITAAEMPFCRVVVRSAPPIGT